MRNSTRIHKFAAIVILLSSGVCLSGQPYPEYGDVSSPILNDSTAIAAALSFTGVTINPRDLQVNKERLAIGLLPSDSPTLRTTWRVSFESDSVLRIKLPDNQSVDTIPMTYHQVHIDSATGALVRMVITSTDEPLADIDDVATRLLMPNRALREEFVAAVTKPQPISFLDAIAECGFRPVYAATIEATCVYQSMPGFPVRPVWIVRVVGVQAHGMRPDPGAETLGPTYMCTAVDAAAGSIIYRYQSAFPKPSD